MSITAQFVKEMKTKKAEKQLEITRIDAAIACASAVGQSCRKSGRTLTLPGPDGKSSTTLTMGPKKTRKTKKKSRRARLSPDSQNGLIRNIIRDEGPMTAKEAHKRVSGMTLHGVQCVVSRLMQRKYLRNDGKKPATYRAV